MIEKVQTDGDKGFQWAFYLNRICLSALGIWPGDTKESRLKSAQLWLILMIIVCAQCLPGTYALIQVRRELNLAVDNLYSLPLQVGFMLSSSFFFGITDHVFHEAPPAMQIVVLIAAALNVNEHIIVYCLACEILATNSSELFDGIYSSRWYDLPPKEARYVTRILARTQYLLRLSAGKFFYLSMNSYVQILKSTAGYISMLLPIS